MRTLQLHSGVQEKDKSIFKGPSESVLGGRKRQKIEKMKLFIFDQNRFKKLSKHVSNIDKIIF